jgi:cytochrome c556
LHELGRTADLSAYTGEFRSLLQASDETAERLCQALAGSDLEVMEREFSKLEKSCWRCHAEWRDR